MGKPALYEFTAVNPTDYTLTIDLKADNKILLKIFNLTKKKYLRKDNTLIKGNPENIDEFVIEPQFHNLMKIAIKKILSKIFKEIKADKIEIMENKVVFAKFKREEDRNWNIHIDLAGIYADKR